MISSIIYESSLGHHHHVTLVDVELNDKSLSDPDDDVMSESNDEYYFFFMLFSSNFRYLETYLFSVLFFTIIIC